MTKTEVAIRVIENLANDNSHGYDQLHRWGPDYDCSSAVIASWEGAGVPVHKNGASYTGNMLHSFLKAGFINVTKTINLDTGEGLMRGDVLLNVKHHTAMYAGNGMEVEASINEHGKATGGTTGDQTGREILIRTYRNYPWDYVLRYKENTVMKSTEEIAIEVIEGKWGNGYVRRRRLEKAGYEYLQVQKCVNYLLRQ